MKPVQDWIGTPRNGGLFKGEIPKRTAYWLAQIVGWSGEVVIETINYTFYIVQRFDWSFFWFFTAYAGVGLLVTHLGRLILIKMRLFERDRGWIWLGGSLFALGTAVVIAAIFLLNTPGHQIRFIDAFSQVMNGFRYTVVWTIIYFMYKLMEQRNEWNEARLEASRQNSFLKLELLKNQINPHFLFNALNSIKALVRIDPEKAQNALLGLSDLLRFSLNYEKQRTLAFSEEIEAVDRYLELEKLRFGDRLVVEKHIDRETLKLEFPPIILLTLAENAIKHGVSRHPGSGELSLWAQKRNERFEIKLINNGFLEDETPKGIGLPFVEQRLHEIYGAEAQWSIRAIDGGRVETTLLIPCKVYA